MLSGTPESRIEANDTLGAPRPPASVGAASELLSGAGLDYQSAGLRIAQAEKEGVAAAREGWIPNLTVSGGGKSTVLETDTHWGYLAGLHAEPSIF